MKWYEQVILCVVVISVCFGTYSDSLQRNEVIELRARVKQGFERVTAWSYETDYHLLRHKDRLDTLAQVLDLSVLDSCGLITNGYGYGSCVAIEFDLILTAGHCIGQANTWIEVQGVQYEIIEQWASENYDVGFVRIDGILPYVVLGQMPALLDEVYLVGSPYETVFVNTITRGIISHLNRDVWDWEDLIQTDAEGAPGSSGCPLFDVRGEIVGICVSGPSAGGGVSLCVSVLDIQNALEEYSDRDVVENECY